MLLCGVNSAHAFLPHAEDDFHLFYLLLVAAEVCLECRCHVDGVDKVCMGITTLVKDARRLTLAQMKLTLLGIQAD